MYHRERIPGHLGRAFEKIAVKKGESSESRIEDVLENLIKSPDCPCWLKDFRRANWQEDRKRGIDFVISTKDVGNLFLQIKSSVAGQEKSQKNHPQIPVLIIYPNKTSEEIQIELIQTLEVKRKIYLEKRQNF